MKKIVFLLLNVLLISMWQNVYAQEMHDNNTTGTIEENINTINTIESDNNSSKKIENTIENEKLPEQGKKKPDFNKKKITLDRIEDKKWSLRIGYSYFFPASEYVSIFSHRLKIGGAYDINNYLQIQAMLQYADGSDSFGINGRNVKVTGTMYNAGVLITGLYPVDMPVGVFAPYASIGGVYTFGNLRVKQEKEEKQNLSGGGIVAQAGLQYSFHVFAFRLYGEYLYDFTPVDFNYIDSLSGGSVGIEIGVKF